MTATNVTATGVLVGTTNAGSLAVVDARGAIVAIDGSWTLDWWVGADDRWHLPADEAAVRQQTVEATPVVETAMRVPTGDAVATVFGARVAGLDDDLIAVDVVNDSTLPFALALVLTGRSEVVVDGLRARIDGRTELRFGRAPSRWAVGGHLDEVEATVVGGQAGDDGGAARGRVAAVLFPLAHTARLRTTLTVPAGRPGGDRSEVAPEAVAIASAPEADQVARGWRAQLDRGLSVRVPDDRLADALSLSRSQLLLAAAGSPEEASVVELAEVVAALCRQGFGDEARSLVAYLATRQRLNGRFGRGANADRDTAAALLAFGDHWRLTRDRSLADALVGPVAKAAHRIGKRRGDADTAAALAAAVDLLAGAGQPEAAALVAALPAAAAPGGSKPAGLPLDQVADGNRAGGPEAGGTRFAATSAILLRSVRGGLVDDDAPLDGPPAIDLFSGFPTAWLGQGIEVHDAPTRHGLVSCAVRWHGERPALLWDRRPWPDSPPDDTVTLSAWALDPTWRSADERGEALLSAPAPPDVEASFS